MKDKFKTQNSNFGFTFKSILWLLLLPLIILSCSGLKRSWVNFRAHYNAYYNAEKSFSSGLKKVNDQPIEVNPELPVRVHLEPPGVGRDDFDNTIEKGAQILRKFPDSKWTDEALFLIGKSYYYKSNFFLALEKFEELEELAKTDYLRRQSAIWKARTLLDLQQYGEGITFVEEVVPETFWTQDSRAEIKVVLAEHYAMQENWNDAARYLGEALSQFQNGVEKGRAYFLYGQVLERLERFGEAFFAYDKVASHFPEYDYIYWSKIKKAEVARKEGNLDTALSIYTAMSRDDKNVERLDRINYEIARTQEIGGDFAQAEEGYNRVLRSQRTIATPNVKAKTYFRLGKLYSDVYKNLSLAAAYYDSASSGVGDTEYLESGFNADELASAYGTYNNLKTTIQRLDSLLWLGSLEPSRLDSVLNVVRQQRRTALQEQAANRDTGTERLLNVAPSPSVGRTGDEDDSYEYGFLNYKSERLRQEASNRFVAVWGNRPLVDNWRRLEVVRGLSTSSEETGRVAEAVPERRGLAREDDRSLAIDLGEIPTSSEQKELYLRNLVNAKYELANLFFITLSMADSAETYFTDIVQNHPESSLVPQSMYSLFEIYSEAGETEKADFWRKRILASFPNTRYAQKVTDQPDDQSSDIEVGEDSTGTLKLEYQQISASDSAAWPSPGQAEKFRKLAIAHRSTEIAPYIYYRAIETYVELAKINTDPTLYRSFMAARDLDSLSFAPDSADWQRYPFYGSYWDSVRTAIQEYDSIFANKPHAREVNLLSEALDTSRMPPDGYVQEQIAATNVEPSAQKEPQPVGSSLAETSEEMKACYEFGQSLDIVGGMFNFISRLDYPSELKGKELTGTVSYKLDISKEGRVKDFRLMSDVQYSGIEEAFDEAISKFLLFDPPVIDGRVEEVQCRMLFPVDS